jgi:hypothetical protein
MDGTDTGKIIVCKMVIRYLMENKTMMAVIINGSKYSAQISSYELHFSVGLGCYAVRT